jgi:MoaA/NifB/PqqE/SkfB family radical SAM enzyme
MPHKYRQEVLNVLLAQLLQERGVISVPEGIIQLMSFENRRIPDVLVTFRGLRTAIEGEFGYQKKSKERALRAARRRVEEGISHIGVAVLYPEILAQVDEFASLKNNLSKSELQIAIVTESGDTGFVSANIDYLVSALSHAFEQLVEEDIVARAVAKLDCGIERFARVMVAKKGDIGRVAECLGIRELSHDEKGMNGEVD